MAWVKLATASASSSTNVQIDNVFTTDYIAYRIVPDLETETAASSLDVRLRAGGTSDTSLLYSAQLGSVTNTSDSAVRQLNQDNWTNCIGQVLVGGPRIVPVDFMIFNPAHAIETVFASWYATNLGAAAPTLAVSGGIYEATTAFDGIDIFGTNPITGTVYIYGLGRS